MPSEERQQVHCGLASEGRRSPQEPREEATVGNPYHPLRPAQMILAALRLYLLRFSVTTSGGEAAILR